MDTSFCKLCNNDNPQCAIFNISINEKFEDILEHGEQNRQKFEVCHRNAIDICNGQIRINNRCDNCSLCQFACIEANAKWSDKYANTLEPAVISEFRRLAILLKSLFPHYFIGTKVQAIGNSRSKRIEVVVVQTKRVMLIKTISNIEEIPKYARSYNEIKKYYQNSIDKEIMCVLLIPTSLIDSTSTIDYPIYTLMELMEKLEE